MKKYHLYTYDSEYEAHIQELADQIIKVLDNEKVKDKLSKIPKMITPVFNPFNPFKRKLRI